MSVMKQTLTEHLAKNGGAQDLWEYQQLKASKDIESNEPWKLYEHLRRKHSETAAIEEMRRKEYDPSLV